MKTCRRGHTYDAKQCPPCKSAGQVLYRERNRLEARQATRAWRQAHIRPTPQVVAPGKQRAYSQAWRDRNPGSAAKDWRTRHGARAARMARGWANTRLWLKAIGRCALCHEPVDLADVSIDHIKPLSKGGEHSHLNTQATHLACNVQKGAR